MSLKAGLKERGEPDDNISDIYENLDYSLRHIKAYFHQKKETPPPQKRCLYFCLLRPAASQGIGVYCSRKG